MSVQLDNKEEEEEEEAQLDIWKYIFGFVEQAVVKCGIELGIADAIESHGGPITLSDLTSSIGCDPSLLYRIMRFLTYRNIFKAIPIDGQQDPQHYYAYAQTPLSRRLMMRKGEHCMAALLLLETSPVMLAPWHSLSARVLVDGKPSFEKALGEDLLSYAAANPHYSDLYNEGTACDAKQTMAAIIEKGSCCSEIFDGVTSLVDVGGGNGTTTHMLAKACPWIKRIINFDLPRVIAAAPHCDGVEHVAGDMFLCVPHADAAFLMWMLHSWGDEECIQILKKCREAIPKEKGRVIIVETVIEEGGKQGSLKDVGLVLDMVMMAHTNLGKERTLKEWDYVIKMAGFSKFTVKTIPNVVKSVIMAFP
ncbi:hypothetical protein RIF29_08322 [Crotalaria pallida]|uniref:O-methyltransferase n=1 Tax=Crotalaria pallida TaxID=3830 RepID=A0AAN9FX03_CROPI